MAVKSLRHRAIIRVGRIGAASMSRIHRNGARQLRMRHGAVGADAIGMRKRHSGFARYDRLTAVDDRSGMTHAADSGALALSVSHSAMRQSAVVQMLRTSMSRLDVDRLLTNCSTVNDSASGVATMTIQVRGVVMAMDRWHRSENFLLLFWNTHCVPLLAAQRRAADRFSGANGQACRELGSHAANDPDSEFDGFLVVFAQEPWICRHRFGRRFLWCCFLAWTDAGL